MEVNDYYSVLNNCWKKIRQEKKKRKNNAIEILVFRKFLFSEKKNEMPALN